MADSTINPYNIPSLERALKVMEFLFRILRTLNVHGYR